MHNTHAPNPKPKARTLRRSLFSPSIPFCAATLRSLYSPPPPRSIHPLAHLLRPSSPALAGLWLRRPRRHSWPSPSPTGAAARGGDLETQHIDCPPPRPFHSREQIKGRRGWACSPAHASVREPTGIASTPTPPSSSPSRTTRTPGGSATTTSSSPTRCTMACGRSSPSPPAPATGAWGPTSARRRRSSCSRASARGAAHSGAAPSATSSATRRRRAASTSSRRNFYSFPSSMSLHLAARSGDLDCIRKLLACGDDRLQRDSAGRIPYVVAQKHNHGACAALLNPSSAEPMVWPSPLKVWWW